MGNLIADILDNFKRPYLNGLLYISNHRKHSILQPFDTAI